MKKCIVLTLLMLLAVGMGTASAAVGDSRANTAALYGDYRIVIDTDNQLWTKLDWEASGHKYAKESTLWHQFWRNNQAFQMVVAYETEKPDSLVQIQRFTPQNAFKLSELKTFFPEVYTLVSSPKAMIFGTDQQITRHFAEGKPEVILGVLVKEPPSASQQTYYTLLAFNIVNEGRVIKHIEQINADTLIREFTMERVARADVEDKMQDNSGWNPIANYFK